MTLPWEAIRTQAGHPMSRIALGCNTFGTRIHGADVDAVVGTALGEGVTLFDTADVYGEGESERELGRALGRRREEVLIATKFGAAPLPGVSGGRTSASAVRLACTNSLARLDTDWIDIFFMHVPDETVPIAETLGALHELVVEGKVRAIACSNVSAPWLSTADVESALSGLSHFVLQQTGWNLLKRDVEGELIPACKELGIGTIPYHPLASGFLTGKYVQGRDFPEGTRLAEQPRSRHVAKAVNYDRVARLREFAQARGHTLVELALSWLALQPTVASVLVGATRPEQVLENVRSADWHLREDDLAAIDRLLDASSPSRGTGDGDG